MLLQFQAVAPGFPATADPTTHFIKTVWTTSTALEQHRPKLIGLLAIWVFGAHADAFGRSPQCFLDHVLAYPHEFCVFTNACAGLGKNLACLWQQDFDAQFFQYTQ